MATIDNWRGNGTSTPGNTVQEQVGDSGHSKVSKLQTLQALFLFTLPVLSIIGATSVRFQNNVILIVMVFLLSLIPILAAFDKIPTKMFDLAIVAVSISLLYCVSLSTDFLWGADIHQEYYFANLVKTRFFWDSTIPNSFNAVLGVDLLAPTYSVVLGMPLIWVFKIVYPLLFSFVPLTLYRVFKRQTSCKIAFLAVFLFVSVFTFYTEMIGLARQQIAEVFYALLILVIVDRTALAHSARAREVLLYIFGAFLIFSHYSIALFFVWATGFLLVLCYVRKVERTITMAFLMFCLVLSISWYTFVAGASILDRVLSLIVSMVNSISGFLNPQTVQPLHLLLTSKVSLLYEVTRILSILIIFFTVVGLFAVVLRRVKEGFEHQYTYFSIANFLVFAFSAVAPYLAASLNTTRLYHITLIVLAPFCIVGAIYALQSGSRVFKPILKTRHCLSKESSVKILSIFLCVFLLFNTGFMYEITNSGSSIMNLKWELEYGSARDRVSLYNSYTPVAEIAGAEWLAEYREATFKVFADYRARNNALNAYSMLSRSEGVLLLEKIEITKESYVYLRAFNIFDNLVEGPREATGVAVLFNSTEVIPSLRQRANLIYSSFGCEVYFAQHAILLNLTGV